MSTDLTRIGEKARREPELLFTSLYHHITDVDNLRDCYNALDGRKAVGVDGVTKEEYGRDLERNLRELSARLKRMGYKPQPKRRVYIPKPGSAKGRPLGISCFEDKLVEESVKRVLEPIYEVVFEDSSYGYRPGRNQHECLGEMGRTIQQRRVNHIVEADIRGFFDRMNHEWLMKFLAHRIGDPRVLRLIRRMLKAGIMEDGLVRAGEVGTPQGSILSPLLSNIYLYYVLDLWFAKRVRRSYRGECYLFRYADDFVVCFQYKEEAESFIDWLISRLEEFHLEVSEEKTNRLSFGRYARENALKRGKKPAEFDFLGFTFYCGKTRHGKFKVKRRTSRKKFNRSLRDFTTWACKERHRLSKGEMIRKAKVKIEGHLGYYAITDNSKRCSSFVHFSTQILYKWINRKSQRRAYNWDSFKVVLKQVGWPNPKIRVNLCPFRPIPTL